MTSRQLTSVIEGDSNPLIWDWKTKSFVEMNPGRRISVTLPVVSSQVMPSQLQQPWPTHFASRLEVSTWIPALKLVRPFRSLGWHTRWPFCLPFPTVMMVNTTTSHNSQEAILSRLIPENKLFLGKWKNELGLQEMNFPWQWVQGLELGRGK